MKAKSRRPVRRLRNQRRNPTRRSSGKVRRTDGNDHPVTAAVVSRHPDPSYPDGLAALADALVLQMFDLSLGETLRMAYTTLQEHQERQSRRAQLSAATDGLRQYLAKLDDANEQL